MLDRSCALEKQLKSTTSKIYALEQIWEVRHETMPDPLTVSPRLLHSPAHVHGIHDGDPAFPCGGY